MLQWSESLSVGIASIDAQHKELVSILNKLHNAMAAGEASTILGQTLDSLTAYTVTHFKTEEGLLKQYGYPDFDAHAATHKGFVTKVVALQEELKSGKALSLQTYIFLKDWLLNHIKGTDQKYAAFFQEKGLR